MSPLLLSGEGFGWALTAPAIDPVEGAGPTVAVLVPGLGVAEGRVARNSRAWGGVIIPVQQEVAA